MCFLCACRCCVCVFCCFVMTSVCLLASPRFHYITCVYGSVFGVFLVCLFVLFVVLFVCNVLGVFSYVVYVMFRCACWCRVLIGLFC